MQNFVDNVDSRLSKHVLTVGGGEDSVCIVVYLCSDVKGMVFGIFVHFKGMLFSALSLLRVDINFVHFKGKFYTNNYHF